MGTSSTFASVSEALVTLEAAMGFLAAADTTLMPTVVQAQCLQTLELMDAMKTAARARVLAAFTSSQGYHEDAAYSSRTWLIHQTRIARGAASRHIEWAQRAVRTPLVIDRLARKEVSESLALVSCGWADKMPEAMRDRALTILLDAAQGGADQRDLNKLGAEMLERCQGDSPDQDPEPSFEDRAVRLDRTLGGAGVLAGDLTPECAAAVNEVLESLSAPTGADDFRSQRQRHHDALHEAMRRLMAGGLLPERAGQPAKVWAHISLADLLALDPGGVVTREWITRTRGQWAAARAANSVAGGDGGAWLDGADATGFACDASISPIVTGDIDPSALEDLVRLCVELAGYTPRPKVGGADAGGAADAGPLPPTDRGREALEQAIIGKVVDLLSGPGGLASFLRRRLLSAKLAGPSLPLDVGWSENVPAGIRNAVMIRDQHCRWAGGEATQQNPAPGRAVDGLRRACPGRDQRVQLVVGLLAARGSYLSGYRALCWSPTRRSTSANAPRPGWGPSFARYPRDSVKLYLHGPQLHVGADQTIYVPPGRTKDARAVVQAVRAH